MFSKKSSAPKSQPTGDRSFPITDERYPGSAGYRGYGLKKHAMPENRFKFVRPDGKSEP
ncbi:MAG TPA: hypothetical protein VGR11_15360 [Solirubrobacteraceae bacterium]|nr:hypothetical protein [Solirubrobacteraceae bacterium]